MKNIIGANTITNLQDTSIPAMEFEILARLPIKPLMRFKCVCKLWKSTIENDPSFIDLYSSRFNRPPSPNRILISIKGESNRYMYSAGPNGGLAIHHLTLPGCRRSKSFCECWVSESLNGLVCYYNEVDVYICNPSTREFKILPRITTSGENIDFYSTFSFVFDPCTKEYMVLHVIREAMSCEWSRAVAFETFTLRSDSRTREVFALDTDSWRSLTGVPTLPRLYRKNGWITYRGMESGGCIEQVLNGAIYWLGRWQEGLKLVLVAFHLRIGEFRFITLPEGIPCYSDLTKIRGCLALLNCINDNLIKMWVLEDNEKQLWINQRIESPQYSQIVKNPFCFSSVYIGKMLVTPTVLSYESVLFPFHFRNEFVQLLPVRIEEHSGKYIHMDTSKHSGKYIYVDMISNHVESLSPLATKKLM